MEVALYTSVIVFIHACTNACTLQHNVHVMLVEDFHKHVVRVCRYTHDATKYSSYKACSDRYHPWQLGPPPAGQGWQQSVPQHEGHMVHMQLQLNQDPLLLWKSSVCVLDLIASDAALDGLPGFLSPLDCAKYYLCAS